MPIPSGAGTAIPFIERSFASMKGTDDTSAASMSQARSATTAVLHRSSVACQTKHETAEAKRSLRHVVTATADRSVSLARSLTDMVDSADRSSTDVSSPVIRTILKVG